MRKFWQKTLLSVFISVGSLHGNCQTVNLTTLGTAYIQNFNALSNTVNSTTNNLTISGWFMTESGGGARDNEQYGVDDGNSTTGDVYSYGSIGSTDRALGGLRSGVLVPLFGAAFTNNTGATINSLAIAYTGEEWSLGMAGRTDQLNFQYSTNATDLVTGSWTNVSALNFITPYTITVGATDGNAAGNRTALSTVITGLNIPNGATFWIRWTDVNATGNNDGLAVDDFSLTPNPAFASATISGDQTICSGASAALTFQATGVGNAVITYADSQGGVYTVTGAANGSAFTATVSSGNLAAGTHTFTIVSVIDDNGNGTGTGSATIIVTAMPTTPTIHGNTNGTGTQDQACPEQPLTLTASSTGATSYQWYGNTLLPGETSNTLNVTDAGTYYVTASNGACTTPQSFGYVVQNPAPAQPSLSANGSTTFCNGGNVTLQSNTATGIQWYQDGVAIPTANSQNYVASVQGGYTAQLNALGCHSPFGATITVTVNPVPPTPTITPNSNTTFCSGGFVELTSSSSTGNQWYLNGTPIGGAIANVYTATASGDYTVSVTAGGCTSTSVPTTVTVNPMPATPTITPSGPTNFCPSGTVMLTSSSATNNQWFLNGGAIVGATNNTYIAAASGDYTVVVTENGCSSSSSVTTVTINSIPPSINGCIGNVIPFTITENSGTTLTNYQVKLVVNTQALISAGSMSSDGHDIRFSANSNGTGQLSYWIDQPTMNTATTNIWVKLNTLPASSSTTIYMSFGNFTLSPGSTLSVFQGPYSATDQVTGGGPGGVGNSQRGFRFSPNEDILVSQFGKNEPTGSTRYITLFDFGSQGILSQTQISGPAGTYSYGNISNPLWLTSGTQYLLEMYQDIADGYYYGAPPQVNSRLTFYDMRYCNGCSATTFPTNSLGGMHYGYSDLRFYVRTHASAEPTFVAGAMTNACSVTLCSGNSVSLGTGAYSTYSWSTGASTQTITVSASGTYSVTVSDALGCVSTSAPFTVTIPIPVVTASGPTTFCAGGSVTLTSSFPSGNQWYINGNLINGAINQDYNATVSGDYTVISTTGNCSTDPSVITTVTVNPIPSPVISAGSTMLCVGGSTTLTSSYASGNQWFRNGNPIGGETNQQYTAIADGDYTVQVTQLGCVGTSSVTTISLTPPPFIHGCIGNVIPFTITENSGTTLSNYQVKLVVNTQALISGGSMSSDGHDIRFSTNSNGTGQLSYWVDQPTMNTATTNIWVKLNSLSASSSTTIYMSFGNFTLAPGSTLSTFQGPYSATDQVTGGSLSSSANSQRGFRFSPNEDILLSQFGKNEPTGSTRYITLFDFGSQAILNQTQISGPAATYSYGSISNPLWLTSGTQYLLEMYQDVTDAYYFGAAPQVNSRITFYDMRYCNGCSQNSFPTNSLGGMHYGYPDLLFYVRGHASVEPTYIAGVMTNPCSMTVCGSAVLSTGTYTSYNWSTGASTQTITVTSAGIYTVTTTDANGCTATAAPFSVTFYSQPTAAVIGTTAVCAGSSTQTITFTGANGTPPYTFTYNINGVSSQQLTTTGGNTTATVGVSASTPGTYSYNLVSVQDANCSQAQSGSATVTVNPLPDMTQPSNVTVCANSGVSTITFTGSLPNTIFNWTNTNASIGLAASGTGTITAFTAINNTASAQTATITVTPSAGVEATTFTYTGAAQAWQVPAGVTSIHIKTWGAQGGSAGSNNANLGGYAEGDLTVTPGETLYIYVGQQPTGNTGGFNGGGNGEGAGYGGGGASDIRQGGNTVNDRKIVSAGGGGGGNLFSGLQVYGGTGGGLTGGNGYREPDFATNPGGEGGTQSGSGNGTCISFYNPAMAGGFGYGGSPSGCGCQGYGGGGGWYGGAGSGNCRGGGGGSSYIGGVNNGNTTPGINAGNGLIQFTYQGGNCAGQAKTFTIQVNPLPTATIGGNATVCAGAPNQLVTFTGANGTSPYTFTYTVTNGTTSSTLTTSSSAGSNTATVVQPTVPAGTYTYTLISVQDANTCSQAQTGTVTIKVNPVPLATISGDATVCAGAATQVVTFTGAGGTAPYTFSYKINNGATQTVTTTGGNATATISQSTAVAGTFTYSLVSVQDASSTACSQPQTGTATIIVNPLPTATMPGNPNQTICFHSSLPITFITTGAGTVTVTFKDQNNTTYIVSGPAGTITKTITPATPGTYTYTIVSVTDGNGCTNSGTGTETVFVSQPIGVLGAINVTCNGGTNGSINVSSVGGGTAPYTFSKDGVNYISQPSSGPTFPNLPAGIYNIYAKDANGCINPLGTSTITQPPAITYTVIQGSPITCNSGGTTSLTITATGGTGTYTYKLDGGASQNSNVFTTGIGTHNIAVTDAAGCTNTTSVTVTGTSTIVFNSVTSTNNTCFNGIAGQIAVRATGAGTITYTLTATGGAQTIQSAPSGITVAFTGLAAGSYAITATDNTNCPAATTAIVSQPSVIMAPDNSNGVPDLLLTSVINPPTALFTPGSVVTITYTISVKNNSNISAQGVIIRITKPFSGYVINVTGNSWNKITDNTTFAEFHLKAGLEIQCSGSMTASISITRSGLDSQSPGLPITATVRMPGASPDNHDQDNARASQFRVQ